MEPGTKTAHVSIRYDDWKREIEAAPDVDVLVRIVRRYLEAWKPEQLRLLPWDLSATALCNTEDIVARAVLASRAEAKFAGKGPEYEALREMALTLAAAATRLRLLKSLRSRA